MKTLLIASVVAALMLVAATPAAAQVRIGVGIHVGVPVPPLPPQYYHEIMVPAPYPGAVFVRGCWSWNVYRGRYVWVPGHWVPRYHERVYVEPRPRHVPHGVAKGWWKKHGRGYYEGY